MDAEGTLMHIDRTDEIAMIAKPIATTDRVSYLGLVCMSANRTPARCASFGGGRARDAVLFGCIGKRVDVAAVWPCGYTAIVMPGRVRIADSVRVTNEERSHVLFDAEVDDLPSGFVS